jgi:hypothetical protein
LVSFHGAYITVDFGDKSPRSPGLRLSATRHLVANEADAPASSRLIATKCHDGHFRTFTLSYPSLPLALSASRLDAAIATYPMGQSYRIFPVG